MENLGISNDEIQQNIAHLNEQLRVERINIHLLQVQCNDLQARVRILERINRYFLAPEPAMAVEYHLPQQQQQQNQQDEE
ncbi:hypothetical protein Mgra_00004351, partial [Meloidogyne graminicola]